MKALKMTLVVLLGLVFMACGDGESSSDDDQGTNQSANVSTREQAELVASVLSNEQGGVGDDIDVITEAADGDSTRQLRDAKASYGYSVSVNIDFYDAQDNLQEAYDPDTTDRIDYDSHIQGEITNGTGYFTELSIDNRSDFTVDEILSRTIWINGIHTNHSSYSRTQYITQAEIDFQLDCEVVVTDLTVDLDADDTFPESGTIEGTLSGSYERNGSLGQQLYQFNFHFIATYMGDNTAEIELDDGTIYIVQLADGSVERLD